jgi:hypothetical protein
MEETTIQSCMRDTCARTHLFSNFFPFKSHPPSQKGCPHPFQAGRACVYANGGWTGDGTADAGRDEVTWQHQSLLAECHYASMKRLSVSNWNSSSRSFPLEKPLSPDRRAAPRGQGCQMVYFHAKTPLLLVYYVRAWAEFFCIIFIIVLFLVWDNLVFLRPFW